MEFPIHTAFADRPTIKEALEYAHDLAKGADKNYIYVLTAVFVVANTMARIHNEQLEAE